MGCRASVGWISLALLSLLAVGCSDEAMEGGRTVSEWAALTDSVDGQTRLDAIGALGRIGPDAQSAVPLVVKRLEDPIAQVAWWATHALAAMGPRGIAALVEALDGADTLTRGRIAQALTNVGPKAKAAVPLLRRSLDPEAEPSAEIRLIVAMSLAAVAPEDPASVPTLIEGLDPRADRTTIANVAGALAQLGSLAAPAASRLAPFLAADVATAEAVHRAFLAIGPTGVPPLLSFAARITSDEARRRALAIAGAVGAKSTDIEDLLLPFCEHEELEVRRAAFTALGNVGVADALVLARLRREIVTRGRRARAEAIAALAALTEWEETSGARLLATVPLDGEIEDRHRIGAALAAFGPDAFAALLDAAASTEDEERRGALLETIDGAVDEEPSWLPRAIPVVADALEHPSVSLVRRAVAALGELPGFDRRMAGALVRLTKSDEPARSWAGGEILYGKVLAAALHEGDYRDAAVAFLAAVGAEEAALRPGLASVSGNHRFCIEVVLALTAEDGAALVPRLTERMEADVNADIRERAALALQILGPRAAPVVPALLRVMSDAEQPMRMREYAGRSLIAVGAPAVDALSPLLAETDDPMLATYLRVVQEIGPACAPLFEKIRPLIAHPDLQVQQQAMRAIGRLGAAARPAVPDLMEAATGLHGTTAAEAFADLGPVAIEAAPLVFRSLQTSAQASWGTFADVLAGMGQGVVPVLVEPLESGPARRIGFALLVLERMGEDAVEAVPALLPLLEHRDSTVRASAARVLGSIGRDGRRIGAALATGLLDPVGRVRVECAASLGHLGMDAASHLDALAEVAAQDEFEFVRTAAHEARQRIREAE